MKMNKQNKIKEIYMNIKNNWKNPKTKALIKLSIYFLLFLSVFIMSKISNSISRNTKITEKINTTEIQENLTSLEKAFIETNHNINYVIKLNSLTYKINGTLKNNIIDGYLESDSIIKIRLKENVLYEIKNDTENILYTEINPKLIDVNNLLELTENERAIINKKTELKEYSYNIKYENENYNIIIYTQNNKIIKIRTNGINIEYILNFDN